MEMSAKWGGTQYEGGRNMELVSYMECPLYGVVRYMGWSLYGVVEVPTIWGGRYMGCPQ